MACFTILLGGGTGSGKTLWASGLAERVPGLFVLGMDRYYRDLAHLPPDARGQRNFDAPDSFDLERLVEDVAALRAGRPVWLPIYDYRRHLRAPETEHAPPGEFLLVEGILALAVPELLALGDLKLFMAVPEEVAYRRRRQRDLEERGRSPESVEAQYRASVRPMHEAHVWPSAQNADLLISGGGLNRRSLEIIAAALLARRGG